MRQGSPIQASGCLPYAVDERSGQRQIYFLLGKEAQRYRYSAAHTWCDYGGGVTGRKNPFHVAVQELQEESFSALAGSFREASELVARRTVLSVVSNIGDRQPYLMLVFQTRVFDPGLPQEFRDRVDVAKRMSTGTATYQEGAWLRKAVPDAFQDNGRLRKHWLEKDDMAWFPIEALEASLHNGGFVSPTIKLRTEFYLTLKKYAVLSRVRHLVEIDENGAPRPTDANRGLCVRCPAPPGFV